MKDDTSTRPADSELLRRFARMASAPAFEELVSRHLNHVFSAALRRVNGDHALAEDVTQTVFADFARKAKRIPANMPPGGWLHRHTGFIASKMIDKERRRRAREQEAAKMNSTELTHADPEWSATAPLIDSAMDTLPNSDRDAIVLRFFEQKDFRTVGAALGVSDDTAQKKVSRAIDKLRAALGKRGVKSTGGALATLMVANSVGAAPGSLAPAQVSAQSLAGAATAGGGLIETVADMTTAAKVTAGTAALALVATAGFAGSKLFSDNEEPKEKARVETVQPAARENARLTALTKPKPDPNLAEPEKMGLQELINAAAEEWRGGRDTVSGNARALGLILQIGPEQMEEALEIGMAHKDEPARIKLLKNLVGHWAETDPNSARKWALSDAAGAHGADLSQALMTTWSGNNPTAAIGLTEKRAAGVFANLPTNESAVANLFRTFASDNLELTMRQISSVPPTKIAAALRGIFDTVQTDAAREKIMPMIAAIPDNRTRITARRTMVEYWTRRDAEAAAAYVDRAEPAWERTPLMDSLCSTWLERDPGVAADWWVERAPGPDTLTKIVNIWAQIDPYASSEWLGQFPAGPGSDTARMTFARAVADLDQESALSWAATVSDETTRESTVDHIYTNWYLRDAQAAENFLQNSGWPQERIARLREKSDNNNE